LIERARDAAFEFSEKLPNFICEEFMSRFIQRGRKERPQDVVSAEIIYDAQESYRNVKIDDRPTGKGLKQIDGSWSTGEFASTLLELFHPDTNAQFRSGGASPISGSSSAQVYDFQVQSEHSHWMVRFSSQTLTAAYQGSVWVESENRARPANRDAGPQHTVRFPDGYGRILGGLFVRDDWRDTLSGTLDGARATAISPAAKASGKIR
jgi:hypothetical protein